MRGQIRGGKRSGRRPDICAEGVCATCAAEGLSACVGKVEGSAASAVCVADEGEEGAICGGGKGATIASEPSVEISGSHGHFEITDGRIDISHGVADA